MSGGRRAMLAMLAMVVTITTLGAAPLACATVEPQGQRDIWVPRDASRGLVIDESTSRLHQIYLPNAPAPMSSSRSQAAAEITR